MNMTLPQLERPTAAVEQTSTVLAVRARGLRLDGSRGTVYGPVDLDIPSGSLTLLSGKAGSGKTSLLLTLVGRMRADRNCELSVLGRSLPRHARWVQEHTGAVGFKGLDDLDEEVTVAATIRERRAWLAPWYRLITTPGDAQVAEVCAEVFADDPVPAAASLVHELDEDANLRLRIALAMLSRPELIVVDDIDQLHDTAGRARVWQSLRRLTERGVTVVVAASGASELLHLAAPTVDRPVMPTLIPLDPPAQLAEGPR